MCQFRHLKSNIITLFPFLSLFLFFSLFFPFFYFSLLFFSPLFFFYSENNIEWLCPLKPHVFSCFFPNYRQSNAWKYPWLYRLVTLNPYPTFCLLTTAFYMFHVLHLQISFFECLSDFVSSSSRC